MQDKAAQMREFNKNISREERLKRCSNGGKEAKRRRDERKKMAEQLDILLSLPLHDEETIKALKEMGVNKKDINNQTLLLAAALKQAQDGNMRATEFIAEMLGENGVKNLNVSGNLPIVISGSDELE